MGDSRRDNFSSGEPPPIDYYMGLAINKAIVISLLVAPVAGFLFFYETSGRQKFALGLVAIGSLAFAIYLLLKQAKPGKPVLSLRNDGIHFTPIGEHALFVPWKEVHGFDLIHYYSPNLATTFPRFEARADCAAVLVTMAWYKENLAPTSVLLKGPFYGEAFVPRGEYMQIVLSHAFIRASGQDLLAEIETRWRAWSGRLENIATHALVTSSRQTKKQKPLFMLANWWFPIALVGTTIAYFWYVPIAYFQDTGPSIAEVETIQEAIFKGGGLVARVEGKPVEVFNRPSIARLEAPICTSSTQSFSRVFGIITSAYETSYMCLQPVWLNDGRAAMGIFRLTPRLMRDESFQVGRFYLDRTFPAWADELLCTRGYCAAK